MSALARWCFRHRLTVVALWLGALAVSLALLAGVGASYSNSFQPPDTPSTQALHIEEHAFPIAAGDSEEVVVETAGPVSGPAGASRLGQLVAALRRLPQVALVESPLSPLGASHVSANRRVAYATVTYDEPTPELPKADGDALVRTAERFRSPGFEVAVEGQLAENAQTQKTSDSTALGVICALVVLGLAFGALFSALLPILTAMVAIGVGYSMTAMVSHVLTTANFAPILGLLIGLGVGVDYALFIVTRHRNGLRAGRRVEDSAVNAVNTAGRAVFFAGMTVCIAMLGQFALGISFLYGVAIAASVTVALTMLASLTLLPALLSLFGMRVLSRRERRRLEADGPRPEDAISGFWYRWSRSVERRPLVRAGASLVLVLVVAAPVLSLRLGLTDAGSDPPGSTTRTAYDLIASGFGPGYTGPFQLVATLGSPARLPAFEGVVAATARVPGVAAVTPARLSPSGSVAVADVVPTTAPQAVSTTKLLHRLRRSVIPSAEAGSGLHVLVGGETAGQVDFSSVLASKLPQFIGAVVAVAFLLLVVVFRSLLIPAIASVMNLLSVGAALGLMNAFFGWGWGDRLIGASGTTPVEVFVPVIMFSILFGLSMDYEVFLVSRIHEEWLRSGDNGRSVTLGQAETGRVITAAALIMILVFLSFLLGGDVIIDQFGIGLSGAIVVDAFVVRTALVPAL
ncbi:MAG TPA: MMPL family transporter, partial [Acidimicrobiales bacterium]|nr:MMPL family transporter [Acidimicrobiales bacterium]